MFDQQNSAEFLLEKNLFEILLKKGESIVFFFYNFIFTI